MGKLAVFLPEDHAKRLWVCGSPVMLDKYIFGSKKGRNSTWRQPGGFPNWRPCSSFEARRFKKAQARRCTRRCSLSLLSTATVVVAVKELFWAADTQLVPSQGPAIPRYPDCLEAGHSPRSLSYHDFSPTRRPSRPLHIIFCRWPRPLRSPLLSTTQLADHPIWCRNRRHR